MTGYAPHKHEVLTSGKVRSLWGLPGGWSAYREALATMGSLAQVSQSVDDLVTRIQQNFPTVRSSSSARGYVRHVLRSLGVVEIDTRGRLTSVSRSLSNGKLVSRSRLARILTSRVAGVSETLELVAREPLSMRHLVQDPSIAVFQWSSDWPIRYRLNWLRAAGIVTLLPESESSERYPQWACTEAGYAHLRKIAISDER